MSCCVNFTNDVPLISTADNLLTLILLLMALNDHAEHQIPDDLQICLCLIALPRRLLAGVPFLHAWPILFMIVLLHAVSAAGYRRGHILIGMGDVKLIAVMYLWIDVALLPVLAFASIAAAMFALIRNAFIEPARTHICLVPFLFLAVCFYRLAMRTGLL